MAKFISIFDKLHSAVSGSAIRTPGDALRWYIRKIRELGGATPTDLLRERKRLRADVFTGNMFAFAYDAKTKARLPYWDKFPLVIPFNIYDDGFIGINLHYLAPAIRVALLEKLLVFANNKRFDASTKLKLRWTFLKGFSEFKAVKPCVKRYLSSHVQSKFVQIDSLDWEIACMLPVERFVKAGKTRVWAESAANLPNWTKKRVP